MTDPMASQMAQLLTESDLPELQQVVERWLKHAPTQEQRAMYASFGAQLVALKKQFLAMPQHPTREELELALTMMLRLAAQRRR